MTEPAKRHTVLLLGPLPPPWTGPAVATQTLLGHPRLSAQFRLAFVNLNYEGQSKARRLLSTLKALCQAAAKMLSGRPRLVYLALTRSAAGCVKDCFFIAMARLVGAPVVGHVHGGDLKVFYDACPPALRRLVRCAYGRIRRLVVLGAALRAQCEGLVEGGRVRVVPNCCDDCDLPPGLARRRRQSGEPLRLVFLSNVLPSKGLSDALEGMALAVERGVRATLTFAGAFLDHDAALARLPEYAGRNVDARTLERDFNSRLDRLALKGSVRGPQVFVGQAKWELLCSSDVLVLPIYNPFEGQPLTIIEAMRAGCAVVTTACGGIADLVQDGVTGRVVRPHCPRDVADALEWLWKNPDAMDRISRSNRLRAAEGHSPRAHADAMISVFREAMQAGGRGQEALKTSNNSSPRKTR